MLYTMKLKKDIVQYGNMKIYSMKPVIFENTEEDNKLCFKIDDVDFDKSNKGVWTMNMEDFKKQAGYTTWDEYKQDKPIEEKEIWTRWYQHRAVKRSTLIDHANKASKMIWVTFRKEGIHKYPAALDDPKLATGDEYDVSFLGYP